MSRSDDSTRENNDARDRNLQHDREIAETLSGSYQAADAIAAAEQQTTSGLHIRCPHCNNPIELVDGASLSDVTCPTCGSSFNLADDSNRTFNASEQEMVNHFRLLDRVGVGAFGSVWSAYDTHLDRLVALKIPRKGQLNAEEVELFIREARAAAQLKHPNIVSVLEVGRYKDRIYLACELIQGVDLAEWLRQQQPTPREAARLSATLADALEHAHQQGVIHRDLKPSNIMLDTKGEPHLMDFGLAKRDAGEITMTVDGKLLGTPAYMSPEQARGAAHEADAKSDIYSMGVILFELLTGERPFRGNTRMLLHQVLTDDAPSPRKLNANVPRDLETICLKCLEKPRDARYLTAADLRDDLQRFLRGEPVMARPVSRLTSFLRWCQRKPIIATLSISLAALILFLAVAGPIVAVRQRMLSHMHDDARQEAVNEKLKAERAEADASGKAKQLSWQLYAAHLANADKAILNHDYQAGQLHLDACPIDERTWEWDYLQSRIQAEITAHFPATTSPLFSSDGQRLFTASSEQEAERGAAVLWDLASQKAIQTYEHSRTPTIIALSSDQTRLAAGDFEGEVVVWDAQSAKTIWSSRPHTARVDGMAFSPDGQLLATASWDNRVLILDTATGAVRSQLKPVARPLREVSFSPDAKWLAIGMIGSPVKSMIIDVAKGEVVAETPGDGESIPTFSPDGTHLATASNDGHIRLWTWNDGRLTEARRWLALERRDNLHAVKSLRFSRDGSHLISGDQASTCHVSVWDVQTGDAIARLNAGDTVWTLATSPTDTQVAFFTLASGTRIWSYGARDHGLVIDVDQNAIRQVAFSPDNEVLVACTSDVNTHTARGTPEKGRLAVYDVHSGDMYADFEGRGVLWSADNAHLVTTDSETNEIRVVQAKSGETLRNFVPHDDFVVPGVRRFGAAVNHSSSSMVHLPGQVPAQPVSLTAGTGTWLTPYDVNADSTRNLPGRNLQRPLAMAISSDGRSVAVGYYTDHCFIELWNTDSQTLDRVVPLSDQWTVKLEYAKTKSAILVGGTGGSLSMIHSTTGELLKQFKGHKGRVFAVAESPDGSRIVAGDDSGQVIIWHTESAQPLLTLADTEAGIYSLDWSGDGRTIAIGRDDGKVLLKTLPVMRGQHPVEVHE